MEQGVVKFFNKDKGYGFITPNSGDKDIFVHQSGTEDHISEGDTVQFEVEESDRGPKATRVKVI